MSKGQNALEFLTVIFIILIFFILLLVFLTQRTGHFEISQNEKAMNMILNTVEREILTARKISGNYDRIFSIPEEIRENEYDISILRGRDIVVSDEHGVLLRFLPTFIYGEIRPGKNRIVKRGSLIGICWDNCSEDYLFNSTGTILCETQEGYFQECDLKFHDFIKSVKVDCGLDIVNASLVISNLDNGEEHFNETKDSLTDGIALFENVNLNVLRSGVFRFSVTCEYIPTRHYDFLVPYGHYVFDRLIVEDCHFDDEDQVYLCEADKFFNIGANVKCLGGECGETAIWIDP